MLSFCGGLKIFLAIVPCDLRKSFNGLYGLVTEKLGEDPRSGALFVFINRRHSRLKILLFDGTGHYFYGSTSQSALCVEFKTGTVKWEERAIGPC